MITPGIRIRLTEDEGRQFFRDQLPLTGTVERVFPLGKEDGPWCVLALDRPFNYQVQDKETKAFRGFDVRKIAIRSRWAGRDIGGVEKTSVFVMIAEDERVFEAEKFDHARCHFDAWAMCEKEEEGQPAARSNAGIWSAFQAMFGSRRGSS